MDITHKLIIFLLWLLIIGCIVVGIKGIVRIANGWADNDRKKMHIGAAMIFLAFLFGNILAYIIVGISFANLPPGGGAWN